MHFIPENSSILIVGTVRNGANTLRRDIARLDASTVRFKRRAYFVAESDSTDNTVSMLETIAAKRRDLHFYSFGRLAANMPLRTERLAFCRNACADFVRNYSQDLDYVLVSDLDNINNRLNESALLSCFEIDQRWDVCTSNRFGRYYDIFALRCEDWVGEDCFEALDRLSNKLDIKIARQMLVESKMITIPRDHAPIEVLSAFAGMGLYRRDAYINSSYIGLTDSGKEICEHVAFHAGIVANGGRILINPRMQVGGHREFKGKGFIRSFLRRFDFVSF